MLTRLAERHVIGLIYEGCRPGEILTPSDDDEGDGENNPVVLNRFRVMRCIKTSRMQQQQASSPCRKDIPFIFAIIVMFVFFILPV